MSYSSMDGSGQCATAGGLDAMSAQRSVDAAQAALETARFRFASEDDLQRGIAGALAIAGIVFEREKRLTLRDRVDFFVAGNVVLEVKIQGAAADVQRQLERYAGVPGVAGILLVTTRSSHRAIRNTLNAVPLRVIYLAGSLL